MAGIWKNNPETAEGKYPIVLRRDGSVLLKPYFVMVAGDPGIVPALKAYARAHEIFGSDPQYVTDIKQMLRDFSAYAGSLIDLPNDSPLKPDPDAPPHRKDDPLTIAWARSVHRQGMGGA